MKLIKKLIKSKFGQFIGAAILGVACLAVLGILLLGGEENAIITLTDHNKPKKETPPPAGSIFIDNEKDSSLSEDELLDIILSTQSDTVKYVSDASRLENKVVNLTGVGRLVASGYTSTDLPYSSGSFLLAELTPDFTVPESFSIRTRVDQKLEYQQLTDYAKFTPVYTDVENPRPAIELYMGYIFVDNGKNLDVYSLSGKKIGTFNDKEYVPAYTRDSAGNPLFYKMTTVESGQYDGEKIEFEVGKDKIYHDREPHEKDKTILVHGRLENKGEGEPMTEEVKTYYTLSGSGYFVGSEYDDSIEGRGLYFNYPAYYGIPDSNISLFAEVYDKYVQDIDGEIKMEHKVDWSFKKWDAAISEDKYERAYNFSEGLACVYTEAYYKDGGMFFVGSNGQKAFPTLKSYNNINADRYVIDNYMPPITTGPESIGYFYYDHGYVRARYEVIDYYNYKDNNKMIVYSSEEVLLNTRGEQFPIPIDYELKGYSDGVLLLEKDGVFGFMDTTGAWIAEPIYTYAEAFYEGLAVLKTSDGRYGMIDTEGNIVLPFGYEYISSCSDGVVAAYSDENGWEIFKKMTK